MGISYTSQEAYLLEVSTILSVLAEKTATDPQFLEAVREAALDGLQGSLAGTRMVLERLEAKSKTSQQISESTKKRRSKNKEAHINNIKHLEGQIEQIQKGQDIREWIFNDHSTEEILEVALRFFGFESGWEIVDFGSEPGIIESHNVQFETPYVEFEKEALITEKKQGRKTVAEPTPAYDALCRFVGIEEIPVYRWIVSC